MVVKDFDCDNCGNKITIKSRFADTVTCSKCKTFYSLENDKLTNQGVVKPFSAISQFKLGDTYQLNGENVETNW